METKTLISIREFCDSHGVERTYILKLKEVGLIELERDEYLSIAVLPRVEKILRFNQEMKINFEGIDVIFNLLEKLKEMDQKNVRLQNRLRIYE